MFMLWTPLRIWLGLLTTFELHYEHMDLAGREGLFVLEVARLSTGDYLVRVPHAFNSFMLCTDFEMLMAARHFNPFAPMAVDRADDNSFYYNHADNHANYFNHADNHADYFNPPASLPVWVAREDVKVLAARTERQDNEEVQETKQHAAPAAHASLKVFAFDHWYSRIDTQDRILSPAMLALLKFRKVHSNTEGFLIAHFNHRAFMNALFDMFVAHPNRRSLVRMYTTMGPRMLKNTPLRTLLGSEALASTTTARVFRKSKLSRSVEL